MFTKSKIARVALFACLAFAWLPIGSVLQPTEAKAAEIIRVGPIYRRVVPVRPIVRVGPVAPVGPVYPWYPGHGSWHWRGFRWVR
jgi:hypothetical protein